MPDLQLQPSISTDLRSQAHLALINRLKQLDLTPMLVYRIASLTDSAVLAMAWQWDVLNPLLLPAISQLGTLNYASWDVIANIDRLTDIDTLSYLGDTEDTQSLAAVYAQYRALILLSTRLHSYIGTPQALKDALTGLGFPDAKILEGQDSWGGNQWPSNEGWAVFRVAINLLTVPADTDFTTLDKKLRAIANFWKPARCWLDSIQYTMALLDQLTPAPSDHVINIFSRTDAVTPAPRDFVTAQFGPIRDGKTIVPLYNDRYYFGSNITYGGTQPQVADGPVVVNGAAIPLPPVPQPGGGSDMFASASLIGTVDGVNPTFTLSPAPVSGVLIFRDGVLLTQGTQAQGGQYLLSGSQLIFNANAIPERGTTITVYVY